MKWCCHSAQNRFNDRHECGEFLVAGKQDGIDEVRFFAGFNMAHKNDYSDILDGIKKASAALEELDIYNIKLNMYGCVHYCSQCGANLKEHYGKDGGLLRDDEYLNGLQNNT